MSVTAGHGKIKQAWKDLQLQWHRTQPFWRDENSRKFEEHYLAPLIVRLRKAEHAMGHINGILNKVRRDCE